MHTHMSSNISLLLSLSQSQSHQDAVLKFLGRQTTAPQDPDLHFINQEDAPLQIEDVRQFTQEMVMRPYQSATSTFVIFQIDRASLPAQNALLKALEEPPEHVQIILTTSRPESVLATIQSRCLVKNLGQLGQLEQLGQENTGIKTMLDTLQNPSQSQYSAAFALSEQYKDRTEATKMLQQLIIFLHRQNQEQPQPKHIQALKAALTTQDFLEKNGNVRLALEDLFFEFKN